MRTVLAWLLASALAVAAADAPLENTGKPIRVAFDCATADLESAGLTCTDDEPCRVFLELTGVESAAGRVFVAGNLHTETTTLSSILLETDDAGHKWFEPAHRIPSAALEEIQFLDFQHGWIAGQSVQPLPRNPFLLSTDDGGRTWQQQLIFEDDQPGSIEQFRFDSPIDGRVQVDRTPEKKHELYHTLTAGANWELEKSSADPIPLPKRGGESAPLWRLEADRKTASWEVEKNHEGGWQRVAAFLTEVAGCKE